MWLPCYERDQTCLSDSFKIENGLSLSSHRMKDSGRDFFVKRTTLKEHKSELLLHK